MENKASEAIVESLNSQLAILSKNGYAIYDRENPETDQLEFETVRDQSVKEEGEHA